MMVPNVRSTGTSKSNSIHPVSVLAYSLSGSGGAGAYPSMHQSKGSPYRFTTPSHTQTDSQTHSHTFTPVGNLEPPVHLTWMLDVFGLWEEMQTPHIKKQGKDSNPRPSCCEATVRSQCLLCSSAKTHPLKSAHLHI